MKNLLQVLKLEDGVYYNKYMDGNKIKMSNPLSDGIRLHILMEQIRNQAQMSKDVTTFLTWAAEPHLEEDIKWVKNYYLSYYFYSA